MQQTQQNYFQLFDLPQSFALDTRALAENYRELQSEAHPDRFAGAAEEEKMRAVQLTSFINEAYATLKSPLQRAGYLLSLHGMDTEQVTQEDLGMDLLMEQLQQREKLAALPDDESALDKLAAMRTSATGRIQAREQAFAAHLDKGELDEAKKLFHELQFLYKLKSEIDRGEEERLGI
ncbi:MAG: Fe-S protein assembly co-chaperone HscB [Pseudohongiellaceae bacterium]